MTWKNISNSFILSLFIIQAFSCTRKPPDGSVMNPIPWRVDAVYQWDTTSSGDNIFYNAFDSARSKLDFFDAFVSTGSCAAFTIPWFDTNSVTPGDPTAIPVHMTYWNDLYDAAHRAGMDADYPYFIYSARALSDAWGNIDYSAGGTTITEQCSPGSKRNFDNSKSMSVVSCLALDSCVTICSTGSVWPYVLIHEAGHLFACLTDVDLHPGDHDINSTCVMHWLANPQRFRQQLLNNLAFCSKCLNHLHTVSQFP